MGSPICRMVSIFRVLCVYLIWWYQCGIGVSRVNLVHSVVSTQLSESWSLNKELEDFLKFGSEEVKLRVLFSLGSELVLFHPRG